MLLLFVLLTSIKGRENTKHSYAYINLELCDYQNKGFADSNPDLHEHVRLIRNESELVDIQTPQDAVEFFRTDPIRYMHMNLAKYHQKGLKIVEFHGIQQGSYRSSGVYDQRPHLMLGMAQTNQKCKIAIGPSLQNGQQYDFIFRFGKQYYHCGYDHPQLGLLNYFLIQICTM